MATPFHFALVTPERVLFSGETDEVTLRTDGGEIAFLARHEDYIGAVDITPVHINAPETDASAKTAHDSAPESLVVAVHGGFVKVDREGVTLLAGVAELSSEIDVARAERALEAAQQRLANPETAEPAGVPSATHGSETEESDAVRTAAMAGAMVALVAPESAEAALRRARTRLEVAGAQRST